VRVSRPAVYELRPPKWRLNLLVLVVSIGIWASGEVVALRLIGGIDSSPGSLFAALVGALWTCGGVLVLFALLWNIGGREVVTADTHSLTIRRCVGPWCRAHSYPRSEIARLRVENEGGGWLGAYWWTVGVKARMIAFDHQDGTARFGDRLDEREAQKLVDELEALLSGGSVA
jgi:hypothetical protein